MRVGVVCRLVRGREIGWTLMLSRFLPVVLLGFLVLQPAGLHRARASESEVKAKLAALKEAVKSTAVAQEAG